MLIPDRTVDCQETLELRRWETMKFTDKFKAKKTENQENPANESPKKEKKPLKQKIKEVSQKWFLQCSHQFHFYCNRTCHQYDRRITSNKIYGG